MELSGECYPARCLRAFTDANESVISADADRSNATSPVERHASEASTMNHDKFSELAPEFACDAMRWVNRFSQGD